jgi:hypothetical protein
VVSIGVITLNILLKNIVGFFIGGVIAVFISFLVEFLFDTIIKTGITITIIPQILNIDIDSILRWISLIVFQGTPYWMVLGAFSGAITLASNSLKAGIITSLLLAVIYLFVYSINISNLVLNRFDEKIMLIIPEYVFTLIGICMSIISSKVIIFIVKIIINIQKQRGLNETNN